MRFVLRYKWLLTVVLVSLLAVQCTKGIQKFAYNTLMPRMVLSRIDDFFDLNSKQSDFLRKRIRSHHRWHRRTQLKLYASDLRSLKKRFSRRFKAADFNWLRKRLIKHRTALYNRILPDMAKFLSTINKEQIDHFEEEVKDYNKDLEKELRKPRKKRHRKQLNRLIDNIEDMTDDLTDGQKGRIRNAYYRMPDTAGAWLAYRKEQQKSFITFMRTGPTEKQIYKDLRARLVFQEDNMPKKYKRRFTRNMEIIQTLVMKIDSMLTAEQRQNALKRIDEYLLLVSELAARK